MPSDLKLAGLLPAEIADRYDSAIKRIEELPVDAPNMDLLADVLELMADLSDIAARALPAPTELSREAHSRDEVVELREALKPFVGDKTFELLLWGDMPDSATGSVSVQLGDFRRARAALSKSEQNP